MKNFPKAGQGFGPENESFLKFLNKTRPKLTPVRLKAKYPI